MSTRIKGAVGVVAGACLLVTSFAATSGSAVAEPPPAPAGTRPVYVTNADVTNDISHFTVDLGTGRPVLTGRLVEAGDGVRQMTFTPDGRMAYAANAGAGTISVYRIGPRGRLAPAATVETGGTTPVGITVAPNGHTLYAADVDRSTVTVFAIASDGSITRRQTLPTAVNNPRGLAMTPDGRFLYAGHGDPGPNRASSVGAVTAYAVNDDGSLTAVGSPVRVGRFDGDLAVTPDGRRMYVISQDTDQVFGFAVRADGQLTALPGSPYTTSSFPEGIAITPDGRFVYTASLGAGGFGVGNGAVSGFAIEADGSLTQVPGSPVEAGLFPVEVTILPNGRFLYASGGDTTGELSAFQIGPAGRLLPLANKPFDTGGIGPAYGSASVLPNQGPAANFATRVDGRTVTFDASTSTDFDGSVATYRWDFGDGTTLSTADPRTTHVYPRAATLRATLVVTDNEGCSAAMVATGRAVLCNGTAAATAAHDIVVHG